MRRCWLRALAALVLVHAVAGSASAQQTGAVVAQVVDSVTGSPIRGAQVHVAGTDIGGLTNDEGRVLFPAVPQPISWTRTVRARPLGVVTDTPAARGSAAVRGGRRADQHRSGHAGEDEQLAATGIPTGLDGVMVKVWWASQGPPN